MYELSKLSRVYPKGRGKVNALKDINLVIQDGDFLTVQGPTAHGKTTRLLTLGGLDRPTSGTGLPPTRTATMGSLSHPSGCSLLGLPCGSLTRYSLGLGRQPELAPPQG